MNKKDKCIIVFTGFNQRAIITFLRVLEKNKVNYAIIAKSEKDQIFLSKYKDKVVSIRKYEKLVLDDIVNSINDVKKKIYAKKYLIAPSTEAINRVMIDKRYLFESLDCIIPLVKKDIYELISDKYSFGKLCKRNDITIPREIKLNFNISLPIVAKPKKYFSEIKKEIFSPIIINNNKDLNYFFDNYNIDDFYYQEYIEGKSIYLLYYFHKNGSVYKFSQENLIQQPNGKSIIAAKSTNFHLTNESDKYEKLFKNIDFKGLVMIEIRQANNKNYMIEANPRFWGPSQLFVDSGNDFFEVFLHDNGILDIIPSFKQPLKEIRYFWFYGLFKVIKNNLKLNFYNIEEEEFFKSLHEWINYDIYKRQDTIGIFYEEIFNGK